MANNKSINEIISNYIDFFRAVQPDLDTKPGTVSRDLFIDAPSAQLSALYEELSLISSKQSNVRSEGVDLERLANNFNIKKIRATPATGVGILTFNNISGPIRLSSNDVVTASNGVSFNILNSITLSPSSANSYRSTATRFREQLNMAGINDEFAVVVQLICTTSGTVGNIGKFSLKRVNINGINNVTNVNEFINGRDLENDTAFKQRLLSSFSGSSVGTALGYQNAVLGLDGVIDAVVIGPNEPLMRRDGTKTTPYRINSQPSILREGDGGKVDVSIFGSVVIDTIDSFIYRDKSNNNDPTSSKNDYILGQIIGDENKRISKRRLDNINSQQLPQQPVKEILNVSGSLSGDNFTEKTVDKFGRVSGNYELIKDTGIYGGSPWGFDRFKWISNKISLFEDDRVKAQFNGQDTVSFSGVLEIPKAQQVISILNENSKISNSDRSVIQLMHYPSSNVTRVFNVNTGERYIVVDQNLDKTGSFNNTGRIKISGNTLPSVNDTLQVDYSWAVEFDQYSDYDGLKNTSNIRSVVDSVDWGYSSIVREEKVKFSLQPSSIYIGSTRYPISTISSVNFYTTRDAVAYRVTSGIYNNRIAVNVLNLKNEIKEVNFVKIKNSNIEQYNTSTNDGNFLNFTKVIGIDIYYDSVIILPSDTIVSPGEVVTVQLNKKDIFNSVEFPGSFSQRLISLSLQELSFAGNNIELYVSYIANISRIFNSPLNLLPSFRSGNGFSNTPQNNNSITNVYKREYSSLELNSLSNIVAPLEINPSLFEIKNILSIIRVSDGLELWNNDNQGIVNSNSNRYELELSGFNSPIVEEKVLIIYEVIDLQNYQPFSYEVETIQNKVRNLTLDPFNRISVNINNFIDESGIQFEVYDTDTEEILISGSDASLVNDTSKAIIAGSLSNFNIPDILSKKFRILNSVNSGSYDITAYNNSSNSLEISNYFNNLTSNNISIIRVSDNKELWNSESIIDLNNNLLIMPNAVALQNDNVYVILYKYKNLKQNLSRLSFNLSDQILNSGTVNIRGTTVTKASNIVFTATSTGLRQSLAEALRKHLRLSPGAPIPSNIKLGKLLKLEKVNVFFNSDEVINTVNNYDVLNSTIKDNSLYGLFTLSDSSLSNFEFRLPSTQNNINSVFSSNAPVIGDKLRATFYYTTDNDSESLSFSRNGVLYTNKKFAIINQIQNVSGFTSSVSSILSINSFSQPAIGSRYKVFYDYLAPKQNERITIEYNYNRLIGQSQLAIENIRIINADVLAKEAIELLLNLNVSIIVQNAFLRSSDIVVQNVRNSAISLLTGSSIGQSISAEQIRLNLSNIPGVQKVKITLFSVNGRPGQINQLNCNKNEYFLPGEVNILPENIST